MTLTASVPTILGTVSQRTVMLASKENNFTGEARARKLKSPLREAIAENHWQRHLSVIKVRATPFSLTLSLDKESEQIYSRFRAKTGLSANVAMTEFRKILCPVDLTPNSLVAVEMKRETFPALEIRGQGLPAARGSNPGRGHGRRPVPIGPHPHWMTLRAGALD